jgi:hypothetical protein
VPEGSPALRVPEHRFTQSASHATPFICRRNRRAHAGWPWHRWSDVHGTSGRTAFRASHPPLCRCLAGLVVLANDGGTAAADGNGTGDIGGEPTGYGLWGTTQRPRPIATAIRRGTSAALRYSLRHGCQNAPVRSVIWRCLWASESNCGTFSYILGSHSSL